MSAGKGDAYRPVNTKVYGENYDAIFRRPKNEPVQAPVKAAVEGDCLFHRYDPRTLCCTGCGISRREAAGQAGVDDAGQAADRD